MKLKDKVVFITGASSGFGASCVEACVGEGARVVATSRSEEELVRMQEDVMSRFSDAQIYTQAMDVRDWEQVQTVVAKLPKEFQAIDILINNAGLARGKNPIQDAKREDWDEMIDVNVKGVLYVTEAILPGMCKRKRGHIVNISSIAGRRAYLGGNVYSATKAAVRMLSQNMRVDLVDIPIRVTDIEPGKAKTHFAMTRYRGDELRAEKEYEGFTPLAAEDVADAVLYAITRPAHVTIDEILITPTERLF